MEQQTPLLGGFQEGEEKDRDLRVEDEEGAGKGTGFGGITPSRPMTATPNPLMTPFKPAGPSSDPRFTPRAAPTSVTGKGPKGAPTPSSFSPASSLATPIRDQMGINTPGGRVEERRPQGLPMEPEGDEVDERLAQARRRLISDLANLPAPKNDYDIVLPDEEKEEEEEQGKVQTSRASHGTYLQKEDAEEADRRRAAVRKAAEEARLKRRTMTLQKSLPRPLILDPSYLLERPEDKEEEFDWASEQVSKEMARLMISDALEDPVPGGKVLGLGDARSSGSSETLKDLMGEGLEKFTDAELAHARDLMSQEVSESCKEGFLQDEDALREEESSFGYLPRLVGKEEQGNGVSGSGRRRVMVSVDRRETLSSEDRVAMARAEWARLSRALNREVGAADRLEARLDTLLKGYQTRAKELRERMDQTTDALESSLEAQSAFTSLAHLETHGVPLRLEALSRDVAALRASELSHQSRYAQLSRDRWAKYDQCRRIYERLHPSSSQANDSEGGKSLVGEEADL